MSYIEWLRGRVGPRKIFLAFASVILWDGQGAVLLQHRTDFDVWGLPGGILEPGESIEACARRELREETGLEVGELSLVGVYSDPQWDVTYPNGDQVQQFTVCFQGTVAGGCMQPDGVETSEQRFFPASELPFQGLPAYYAAMLRDALQGAPPASSPPYAGPLAVPQVETVRPWIGRQIFIGVGAVAIVQGEDGRILMIRRSDDGEWDFPSGYLDLGENAAHCALRETREETGLEIELERLLGIYSPVEARVYPNGDAVQSVDALFLARPAAQWAAQRAAHPAGLSVFAGDGEAAEIAWLTAEEIQRQPASPAYAALKTAALALLADQVGLDADKR